MAPRQAAPWRRKMSATSSTGRDMADASGRRCFAHVQQLERGLDLADHVERDPGIARCGLDVTMAKQVLDHADVDALLQEMGGKAMPERVHRHRFVEASGIGRLG